MKKKYQVFISSTYKDLKDERIAVMHSLLDNDCIPVGMEQFPASNMSQMDYIKMMLDDCDYYILILAGKYGSLAEDDIGFTEKEYDYAINNGIPVMSFVFDNIDNLPRSKCETTAKQQKKLDCFRKKVTAGKLVKFYSDIGSLTTQVVTSLHRCIEDYPANGWVRGNNEITSFKHLNNEIRVTETISSNMTTATYGGFEFDYSNNNGTYIIGRDEYTFHTKWSKASNTSIYAYTDGCDIEALCLIRNPGQIELLHDFTGDFSSRTRNPRIGDAILWRNKSGHFAITKIIEIDDDSRGAIRDRLKCDFIIYT